MGDEVRKVDLGDWQKITVADDHKARISLARLTKRRRRHLELCLTISATWLLAESELRTACCVALRDSERHILILHNPNRYTFWRLYLEVISSYQ